MLVSGYAGTLRRLLLVASAKPAHLSLVGTAARLSGALPIRAFSVSTRSAFPAAATTKKKPAATSKRTSAAGKKLATKRATTTKKKSTAKSSSKNKTTKAKKKPVKKRVIAKKKKAAPRKRKALTQEQKDINERRALKRDLLKGPEMLPTGPWRLFISQKAGSLPGTLGERISQLSQAYKNLNPAEVEKLHALSEKNKVTNETKYAAWVESKPPGEIKAANLARTRLSNKFAFKSHSKVIRDHRIPKRPCGVYGYFMKSRWASGEYAGSKPTEAAKAMGAEWKALPEAQKQTFREAADAAMIKWRQVRDKVLA